MLILSIILEAVLGPKPGTLPRVLASSWPASVEEDRSVLIWENAGSRIIEEIDLLLAPELIRKSSILEVLWWIISVELTTLWSP